MSSSIPIRRRLALRATRTQAVIGVVFVVLGFLLVLALRDDDQGAPLQSARTEDLVTILDDVTARRQALEAEARRLEVAKEQLTAGSQGQALLEAERRANALEILAGTTEVTGPGIEVRLDGIDAVTAATILDAVQELRDAGAEAISVGGQRVIASTWFADQREGIVVSGVPIAVPVTVLAIGAPDTMGTALQIPGGVAQTVRAAGGSIEISTSEDLRVPAAQ